MITDHNAIKSELVHMLFLITSGDQTKQLTSPEEITEATDPRTIQVALNMKNNRKALEKGILPKHVFPLVTQSHETLRIIKEILTERTLQETRSSPDSVITNACTEGKATPPSLPAQSH